MLTLNCYHFEIYWLLLSLAVLLCDFQESHSVTYYPSKDKVKGNELSPNTCNDPKRLARIDTTRLVKNVCDAVRSHKEDLFWTGLSWDSTKKFFWIDDSESDVQVDQSIASLVGNSKEGKQYCFLVNKTVGKIVEKKCTDRKAYNYICEEDTITSTLVSAVVASSEKGTIGKSTTMTSSRSIVINDMEVTETKPDLRKVTMTITLPMTSSSSSSLQSQSSSAAATAVSSLSASISSSLPVLSPYLLSVSSWSPLRSAFLSMPSMTFLISTMTPALLESQSSLSSSSSPVSSFTIFLSTSTSSRTFTSLSEARTLSVTPVSSPLSPSPSFSSLSNPMSLTRTTAITETLTKPRVGAKATTAATTRNSKNRTWFSSTLLRLLSSKATSLTRHTSSTAASRYPERSTEANPGLESLCDKVYRKIGPIKKQSADTKLRCFSAELQALDATEKNSFEIAVNATSQLFRDLETDPEEKSSINVLLATQQLETFALKYGKIHYKQDQRIVISKEHFAIKLQKVPVDHKEDVVAFDVNETGDKAERRGARISLPLKAYERKEAVTVFIVYNEAASWDLDEEQIDSNMVKNAKLGSRIISGRIQPSPSGILKENVTISFSDGRGANKRNIPHCVFWDFTIKSKLTGDWSTKGCSLVETIDSEILCSCNHLTNFAVLMEVKDNTEASSGHKTALETITYIGCALSIVGELLTMIAYCTLTNVKQEPIQIRLNLVTSLAIAQAAFLAGIDATEEMVMCIVVAAVIHYFYLVGFSWMLFEGIYLYLLVCKVFNAFIRIRIFYAVAWGVPAVIVALTITMAALQNDGILSYVHGDFCWVSRTNELIWTFVAPVLVVCLVNLVLLSFVLYEIRNMPKDKTSELEKVVAGFKACVVLSPLLGVTWLFGVLSIEQAGLAFQYIFTILNSLQGLFIFLFHIVRNGDLRAELRRRLMKYNCMMYLKASQKKQPSNILRINKVEDSATARHNEATFHSSYKNHNNLTLNTTSSIPPVDT
ncbi:adhesion G protein-coupled receptor L4-like isoform X2 [Acropora muricata]